MQIKIDGELYTDTKGEISDYTVIQVCQDAGVTIPRFCYHDRLSVAGNCRMCLVEVSNAIKPMASCAIPRTENMEIYTNSTVVKKAREGIMEFLLLNHPLDCPICDQGGECDLQDQAMLFGNDRGRFYKYKRAVTNKNCGPLIKTMMTRCIHCTRCVRYSTEVAGLNDFGATGRGNTVEIGSYVERTLKSEISGNIIDLCPVGALTSKPYAFTARSWELKSSNTVDIYDTLGANIKVDIRGNEIMRVLPRLNESINEEWITDKTRFSYDGLKSQRLDNPKFKKGDVFQNISWKEALQIVKNKFNSTDKSNIAMLSGDMTDGLTLKTMKDLSSNLGINTCYNVNNNSTNVDIRSDFLFNESFDKFEDTDVCLLIGANLRLEAPLLNARLLKLQQTRDIKIGYIGSNSQNHVIHEHLGNTTKTLYKILQGNHAFSKRLFKAKNPTIIIGTAFLNEFNNSVMNARLKEGFNYIPNLQKFDNNGNLIWNGLNVLQDNTSTITAKELGINSIHANIKGNYDILRNYKLIYAANVDNILFPKDAFVIYHGHHGDKGALQADLILPALSFIEKETFYVNANGLLQFTNAAITGPGQAKEDWKIIKAISEELNISLPYSNKDELLDSVKTYIPNLKNLKSLESTESIKSLNININSYCLPKLKQRLNKKRIINNPRKLPERYKNRYLKKHDTQINTLNTTITNYFRTNVVTNASKVMSKCSVYRTKSNFVN